MSMYCPNCYKRHSYIETFCSHCGVKLKRVCPKWDFLKSAFLAVDLKKIIKAVLKNVQFRG